MTGPDAIYSTLVIAAGLGLGALLRRAWREHRPARRKPSALAKTVDGLGPRQAEVISLETRRRARG